MTQAKHDADPLDTSARPALRAGQAYALLLGLAFLVFVVDQASKRAVAATLQGGRVVDLFAGLIRLDYAENSGAAFGLFKSSGLLFVFVALAVAIAIAAPRRRIARLSSPVRAALGLVLGGALGNAADRLRLGYVVDFIDLRWWPVFNLADSAIVVGAVLLTAHSLWISGEESAE